MTTWIVTTGNSDIQIQPDAARNWESLYEEVRKKEPLANCDEFLALEQDRETNLFPVPARVLGLVYGHQPDSYKDLAFPLLDTFYHYFQDELGEFPSNIVVILTDQEKILKQQLTNPDSSYWQDTCKLQAIFEQYFARKFNIEPRFLILEPESGQGLDHWNETLLIVEKTLYEKQEESIIKTNEIVYVSHQAGTPAISSAVQFVSLGLFKDVQFLVSHQYYDDEGYLQSKAEAIASSRYWRGMQIQKAKQLVIDGLPGAALNLVTQLDSGAKYFQLEEIVGLFNVKSSNNIGPEFMPKSATQRIIDALALIEIFFEKENYIQGITLLAAAQETFLKVAITTQVRKLDTVSNGIKLFRLIKWSSRGLYLKSDNILMERLNLNNSANLTQIKIEILEGLNFPVNDEAIRFWDKLKAGESINFGLTNSNHVMLKWLCNLTEFKPWGLLTWISQYKREHEADKRNQLMHNLLGVKPQEVIKYLLGNQEDSSYTDVLRTYQNKVKTPFLEAIKSLGLPYQESTLAQQLQTIADSLR